MKALIPTFALAGAAAIPVLTGFASTAGAAEVTVYGPRPVYVAPAPRVYVAPTRTVTVGPKCVSRTARVWVDGHYVQRTLRNCI